MNTYIPNNDSEASQSTTASGNMAEIAKTEENTRLPVVGQLVLLSALMLLIFGSTLTPKIIAFFNTSNDQQATVTTAPIAETFKKTTSEKINAFEGIDLAAEAAYVWDVENQKVLYRKNEDEQLPLASITKLMTALVAEEVLEEDAKVAVQERSVKQDGGGKLREGEVFRRIALSDMMLMASSNDGAFALAEQTGEALGGESDHARIFVDAMNIRAQEIGLKKTFFKNPTGLDISSTEGGAYGTAREVAFLMEYMLHNHRDLLSYTTEHAARFYDEQGTYHDVENTNDAITRIPGLIGSKTGYTELAGGNLVISWNIGLNRPIIAVVLGSTQQERFSDILTLVKETQKIVQ